MSSPTSHGAASQLPLRYPDLSSPDFMTRRAWWLLGANAIVPGAGSILGGNRRFGRFMLRLWLINAGLILLALVMWFVLRGPLLFVFTTTIGLTVLSAWMLITAGLVVVSFLDTLRLTRLIRVDPFARGLVAVVAIVVMVIPVMVGFGMSSVVNQGRGLVSQLFADGNAGLKLPSNGRLNILMLGGDTGADREGTRPDSISVMSFDMWTGQLVTIGVPRNLERFAFAAGPMRERYPDVYTDCDVDVCYLNSVYTEVELVHPEYYPDAVSQGSSPGIEATRDAVEGITGLEIPYYVMVDMQGFADLIDALGGVDIEVTERVGLGINDDGSEGWEPPSHWIEPGMQHMDGEIALWYARSRYESDDFSRMQRQRQLQEAIIAKLTPSNLASRMGPVTQAITKVIRTDLPEGMAGVYADMMLKSRGQQAGRLDLVPPTVDIEDPNVELMRELVRAAIEMGPTPAPTQ